MHMIIAALLVSTSIAPVAATSGQDPLVASTDPADRAVMAEAAAAVAARPPSLQTLDAVLAKLPRPTPLRGMVQTARAVALADTDRRGDTVAALEEALRLLPTHPVPKLTAAHILTFTGAPQRAADLWMDASRIAPDHAAMSDPYIMNALVGRLRDLGDRDRADRLQARMGEIGFASALAPARSAAALATTRAHMAAGRQADAEASLSAIGGVSDLAVLLVDKRYEVLWPRIEQWAGPRLEGQSRRQLEELRREWSEPRAFDPATNYARRLAAARAYDAVVALFLPVLDAPDLEDAEAIEFLTPVVARSLLALGRRAEAEKLVAKVAALVPEDDSGRSLNLLGSRITLDALELRWGDVLDRANTFVKRAEALGPSVNSSATLMVRALRGCALWNLGRRDEAAADMAAVMLEDSAQPANALRVLSCRGEKPAARDFLVARLESPVTREWALMTVQPGTLDPAFALHRADHAFLEEVRRDPAVTDAVKKVGRILPYPISEQLPPGFDPFEARPAAKRAPGAV